MTLNHFIEFLTTPSYLGILILMFSAFLIGYFAGVRLTSGAKKKLITRLKNEVNSLKLSQKPVKDIDTIFTEIKPKILQVVQEAQRENEQLASSMSMEVVAEKRKSQYVNYTPGKPQLDFENFGYGDSKKRDKLTEINGIGPYIEQKLNEIGIYNFDQISHLQIKDIRQITKLIDFFPGRIERDDWIGQAKRLKVLLS